MKKDEKFLFKKGLLDIISAKEFLNIIIRGIMLASVIHNPFSADKLLKVKSKKKTP